MASEQQKQKQSMAEAPLKRPPVQPPEPADREREGASTSPAAMIGFMLLAFSSAMTVSSWHRGFGAVSFLVLSFLDLAMLFHCLCLYARMPPPGSPRREMLKMAAWLLAAMLTVTFFQLLELWFLMTVGKAEIPITDFQKPRRMG